jgi:hypothetical protein
MSNYMLEADLSDNAGRHISVDAVKELLIACETLDPCLN